MSNPAPSSSPYQFQAPQQQQPYNPQQYGQQPPGQQPPYEPKMGDAPPPYPGTAGSYPTYGMPPPAGMAQPPPVHAYYVAPDGAPSTTTVRTTTVIVTGNCPKCHVGHLREENNAAMCILVAILAFLFFPIGLLYFLCLPAAVIHTCDNCGYTC